MVQLSDYQVLVKANEQCAKDFGIDQLSCISDPYRETHGFGAIIEYLKDGPPRSTHPLQDSKDLSKLLKPDPLKSERMRDRIKAAEAYKETSNAEYSILGWIEGPAAEAANLRDVTTFMMDLIEDDVFASELMDVCVEAGITFARAQVDAGADTIGDRVTIAGNMDPVSAIQNATPTSIRGTILNLYEEVGNPYMVNAGCEIPAGTPTENLRALCEPVPYQP